MDINPSTNSTQNELILLPSNNLSDTLKYHLHTLICEKWLFIDIPYPIITLLKYHRSCPKDITHIQELKQFIVDKLGYIGPFYFLSFYALRDHPGPFRNAEKSILLLYHLLSGKSTKKMAPYLPASTFYEIYKDFWIVHYSDLNEWLTDSLYNLFSNVYIRVLSATLKNPDKFKFVTMFCDGHDNKFSYADPHISKSEFFSYKLDKPGIRTQITVDINSMFLFISPSRPCKDYSDGKMLVDCRVDKIMNSKDCLQIDGGYTLSLQELLNKHKIDNGDLSEQNFCFPYRKQKGINLTPEQLLYNQEHGSMRSTIETLFATISNIFLHFHPSSLIRASNFKSYNVQLKFACLMLNFKHFCQLYNIMESDLHKMWFNENFDFPSPTQPLNIPSLTPLNDQLHNIQKNFIKSLLISRT